MVRLLVSSTLTNNSKTKLPATTAGPAAVSSCTPVTPAAAGLNNPF